MEAVELDRNHRVVWRVVKGRRVAVRVDAPVSHPPATKHFCPACGCWLLNRAEQCPACTARDEDAQAAHAAAVHELARRHRGEYERLVASEARRRGLAS